ncbi:MAG: membrane integrity-associated transporter subunit PqiC [Candidatus Hydrogenedentes bacterium]|nr:membrane integrity-associated transporter subunit PqiC [Candidatus Hydrogenedentota bacterium]
MVYDFHHADRKRCGSLKVPGLAVFLVLLAGCAHSPEPRFYTLDMTPSGKAAASCNIEVERLRPHDALTRVDLMVKTSPTQVEYYALDRWAATLSELVPEKLRAEFGAPLAGRRTLVLSGTILAFEQVDTEEGANAHVKLDLELRNEGDSRYAAPLLQKVYEIAVPAGQPAPADVVRALSSGLETLATQIAADAGALP